MSEIDDIIDSIELEEMNEVSSNDMVTTEDKELDITDQDEISKELVDMVQGDREKADKIFDLFYGNLALNQDNTTASKEALTKSLELKIEASKNIIELLKVKARAEERGNNVGVFFGATPAKKAGFDVDDILIEANHRNTKT
jgi:hypothetical protein